MLAGALLNQNLGRGTALQQSLILKREIYSQGCPCPQETCTLGLWQGCWSGSWLPAELVAGCAGDARRRCSRGVGAGELQYLKGAKDVASLHLQVLVVQGPATTEPTL